MKKFLWLLLLPSLAFGGLQVCPRMPVATATANNWVSAITAGGATTLSQPAFTNISGSVAATQMPALTGDITTSAGAVATTLATVNSNVGTFGDSTHVAQVTVNGKGLVTAASNVSFTATVNTGAPVATILTSGSSATFNRHYTFIITSGSATVGATYTNNAVTYTVYATVASATQVVMSGSGAPAASGTLTKASGTGDSTLTFSQVLTPLWARVRAVGGGGGGSGSGTAGGNTGIQNGGDTTWTDGTLTLTAGGGQASTRGGNGGTGGSASISGGLTSNGITQVGDYGDASNIILNFMGGRGGRSVFPGAGQVAPGAAAQTNANTNSGSGGSGGGTGATASSVTGSGGGAGGYVEYIIKAPAATYTYTVGAGGNGANSGTNGFGGSNGGAGQIYVEEFFQ